MDALIFTAMSGAERALRGQQVHANNLANMDTGGFRANMELSTAQTVNGYGYDDRHMSQLQANSVSTRQGTLKRDRARSTSPFPATASWPCRARPARPTPAPAR
jgi:flagellar basal body rod protein FlgF